jgi:membrane-bound lytic murein transglycosylase B
MEKQRKQKHTSNWAWQYMSVTSAPRRWRWGRELRQENLCEFEASVADILSSRPATLIHSQGCFKRWGRWLERRLRSQALVVLAEDLGSVSSTHIATYNHS